MQARACGQRNTTQASYLRMDLAHCSTNSKGPYLNILVAVHLVTGWTEYGPLWGKSQNATRSAVDNVRPEASARPVLDIGVSL